MRTSSAMRTLGVSAAAVAVVVAVTGCSGDRQVSGETVAARVAATVGKRLQLVPEVDCGTASVPLKDGQRVSCRITDPEAKATYQAAVRIVNPRENGSFGVSLSVDPTAKKQ
jgi:hypothetical protein